MHVLLWVAWARPFVPPVLAADPRCLPRKVGTDGRRSPSPSTTSSDAGAHSGVQEHTNLVESVLRIDASHDGR